MKMGNLLKNWRIVAMLAVGFAAVVVAGCNDRSSDDKVIKVGMSADYPPFESYNNGEIVGFDVDVINKVAEHMGRKVQLQSLSFDNLIGALESKRIDLAISSMTMNEERAKKLDFSDVYYQNSFSIVYRNGQPLRSEDELKGKKIGAQTGTTMDKFLKQLGNVKIFSLNNNNIMIEELKLGRIDGVLLETAQAVEFVRSNPVLRYQKLKTSDNDGYSIAFPKESKLRDEVNLALIEMKKNGELDAIKSKWIIEDTASAQLSEAESAE